MVASLGACGEKRAPLPASRLPHPPAPRPPWQDDSNPDFVSEVVELYFEDSASKIEKLDAILRAGAGPDFNKVDEVVHQFKGSSASFGAHAMAHCCVQLREACHAHDTATCQALLGQLQASFLELRGRLETLLQLEQQRKQS